MILTKQQKEEQHNLISAAAVIGYYLGFEKIKLGNEGLMLHYDLIQQLAVKFCVKFPAGFDWEGHREKGGQDWDIEIENFTIVEIKNIHVDINYY